MLVLRAWFLVAVFLGGRPLLAEEAKKDDGAWVRDLDHSDAGRRRAARLKLRYAEPPWPVLRAELLTGSAQARRVLRRYLQTQLYYGTEKQQRAWIQRLVDHPGLGLSFLSRQSALRRLADRDGSPAAPAARVAVMRLEGSRRYVVSMAKRVRDRAALRGFLPAEAERLIRAAHRLSLASDALLEEYLEKLAADDATAGTALLDGIAEGRPPWGEQALDVLVSGPVSPRAVEAVALRLATARDEETRELCGWLLALPWPSDVWRAALAKVAQQRLPQLEGPSRAAMCAVLARAGGAAQLKSEAQRDDLSGFLARAARSGHREAQAALQREFLTWPAPRRLRSLGQLAAFAAPGCDAILLDRLIHGDAAEKRTIATHARRLAPSIADELRRIVAAREPAAELALAGLLRADDGLYDARNLAMLCDAIRRPQGRDLRAAALVACRRLTSFPAPLAAAFDDLLNAPDLQEQYALVAELGGTLRRLRELQPQTFLALFARIGEGRVPVALVKTQVSLTVMRQRFLKLAITLDVRAPATRRALQAGVASDAEGLRMGALAGYRRIRDPMAADRRAVQSLLTARSVDLRRSAQKRIAYWKAPSR